MKFGITILVALVVFLSPSVHGAENDVIRVFDDKLHVTEKEMSEYLKQADLENYGFEKTVEQSMETDKNGKKTTKKTTYYKVTDDCSRLMFWEGVLEQRLPTKLTNSKLVSKIVKEVQDRISGRKTKSCTVMLEIHTNRCANESTSNSVSKRAARKCLWNCGPCNGCEICSGVAMVYDE